MAQHPGAGLRQHRVGQQHIGLQPGAYQRHLQRRQVVRLQTVDQPKSEMCAHAGPQHLGRPQRSRALQRQHLPDPEGRSAAQDAADVAGVLHPVEYHAGRVWIDREGRRHAQQKTQPGWRLQRAEAIEQRIGHPHHARRPLRQGAQRRLGPGAVGHHRLQRPLATFAQRRAQVLAFQPQLAGLAVAGGVARQLAQPHQQRVVARGDKLRLVHSWPPSTARTGAKLRRCATQAPCACSAARWSAVG